MRLYTHIQRKIQKINNIQSYRFAVDLSKADNFKDWVVAGIVFSDYNSNIQTSSIFTVYLYSFRQGFQAVSFNLQVQNDKKTLYFSCQCKPVEGEQPRFTDQEAAQILLDNLILTISQINRAPYNHKTLNLFTLIEKIGWNSQIIRSKAEQSTLIYKILIGAGIVGLFGGLYYYWSGKLTPPNKLE